LILEENRLSAYPDCIAVIGGGRWARVLTEVLCELIPKSVKVSVHTRHNVEVISRWISARGLASQVYVSPEWPKFVSGNLNAVIVANAAHDHEKSVRWALSAGAPVLVEKPISLNAATAQQLIDLALHNNIRFAAAHVFLFARYVEKFSSLVAGMGQLQSLRVYWTDPQFEYRYGEEKQYDSSLPIFSDFLPHILSVIGTLMHSLPDKSEITKFKRGGACLELKLLLGNTPCIIWLERKSDQRRRLIIAKAEQKMLRLDFCKEPGIITDGFRTVVGDSDWDFKQHPVARMLTAFLKWVVSGDYDSRLDINIGLRTCQVIDKIADEYHSAMKSWLADRLSSAALIDDDIRYALYEILQCDGRLSVTTIEKQIDLVRRHFADTDRSQLLKELQLE
jgi:predicted dehydrogenase